MGKLNVKKLFNTLLTYADFELFLPFRMFLKPKYGFVVQVVRYSKE